MGEFIFNRGRSKTAHSYPEAPRGGSPLTAFARNFAAGPATDTAVPTAGIEIPWGLIYSGASPGVNIPITPRATGRIRVSSVIAIKNNSDATQRVTIVVRIGAIELAFPFLEANSIEAGGVEMIPVLAETLVGEALPLGASVNARIFITSTDDTDVELVGLNSTIEVQEVPIPTG